MHLTRCQDQKRQSLEEFYRDIANGGGAVHRREIGMTMLGLLARLRGLDDKRLVWGLTSHYHLCLLARDSSKTPSFVIFVALDSRNYFIEYLMPEHAAPWPHAYVKGEAQSEDEAVKMILTGMEKSEGWSER